MKLHDTRSRDELIRDDYAVPDESFSDGVYELVLENGELSLTGFKPTPGAAPPITNQRVEDTSGAKWWKFLAGNRD